MGNIGKSISQEMRRLSFSDPRRLFDEKGNLKPIHELSDNVSGSIASEYSLYTALDREYAKAKMTQQRVYSLRDD